MSTLAVRWVRKESLPVAALVKTTSGRHSAMHAWVQEKALCDFCSGPLQDGLIPIIEDMRAIMTTPAGTTVMEPPWALCATCQEAVGLSPGDLVVEFSAARRLHRGKSEEKLRGLAPWARGKVKVEVYGPG